MTVRVEPDAGVEPDVRLPDGRRVVVGAVLLHPDGRVLLQLRDDKPGIVEPGKWSLFGGGLDVGETPAEGMRREIAEEIGFDVRHFRPLLVFDGWRARYNIFLAAIDAAKEELVLAEGAGFDYWEPEDALAQASVTSIARLSILAMEELKGQRVEAGAEAVELLPGAGY